jgi:hypothetical protein
MNNITENNKLMAEFMGLTIITDGISFFDINYKPLKNYHSDWNWLMEVVDKIESMDFVLNIRQGHVSIVNNSGKTPFYTGSDIVEESKIESVYNTCVEFIKWYNKCG